MQNAQPGNHSWLGIFKWNPCRGKDEICYADEIQADGLDEIKSTRPQSNILPPKAM